MYRNGSSWVCYMAITPDGLISVEQALTVSRVLVEKESIWNTEITICVSENSFSYFICGVEDTISLTAQKFLLITIYVTVTCSIFFCSRNCISEFPSKEFMWRDKWILFLVLNIFMVYSWQGKPTEKKITLNNLEKFNALLIIYF